MIEELGQLTNCAHNIQSGDTCREHETFHYASVLVRVSSSLCAYVYCSEFTRCIHRNVNGGTVVHPMTFEQLADVLILVDFNRSVFSVLDFHAKELSRDSQILHLESFARGLFNRSNIFIIVASDEEVVDIEGNIRPFTV